MPVYDEDCAFVVCGQVSNRKYGLCYQLKAPVNLSATGDFFFLNKINLEPRMLVFSSDKLQDGPVK